MFGTGYIDSIKEKFSEPRKVLKKDIERLEKAANRGDLEAACLLGAFFLEGNNSIKVDKNKALQLFKIAAEGDYSPAYMSLYGVYSTKHDELDFEKNDDLALEYLKKAVDDELPPALLEFGLCCKDGYLVEKDLEKAYSYFEKALENGEIDAAKCMANMIMNGECKEKDLDLAVKLYTLGAIRENDPYCQAKLGELYLLGKVVEENPKEAFKWLTLAAKQEFPVALMYLSTMYNEGIYVEEDHEKAQKIMAEAMKLGLKEVFENAGIETYAEEKTFNEALEKAEAGDVDYMAKVAEMYLWGHHVECDAEKAFYWAEKASENGSTLGMCVLAEMYLDGYHVDENPEKALELYTKAADLGEARGFYGLNAFYEEGICVEPNKEKAVELMKKSAELGYDDAMMILGLYYAEGDGVEKDPKKAVEWLEKAIEKGNMSAKRELGLMYRNGDLIEKNLEKAEELLKDSMFF